MPDRDYDNQYDSDDNHYASNDDWGDDRDFDEGRARHRRRRKESGCGIKIVIALGIGFVVICIAVCAGGYFYVQKGVTTEPDKVRDLTQSIIEVDVPPQVLPIMGIDLSMLGNNFVMAIYADHMGGSMWIMSVPAPYDPVAANVDDVLREMEQQQQQKPDNQKQKVIKIEKREDIEKQVNGKLAKFLVASGKDENGVPHTQVTGVFLSEKENLGMFNLVISEQQMDMAAGKRMVESVK